MSPLFHQLGRSLGSTRAFHQSRFYHTLYRAASPQYQRTNKSTNFKNVQITSTQQRYLNLHEYQSKQLMEKYGVRVQRGSVASTPDEAKHIAEQLLSSGAKELVLKAQIHAGGRGKGVYAICYHSSIYIYLPV